MATKNRNQVNKCIQGGNTQFARNLCVKKHKNPVVEEKNLAGKMNSPEMAC